MARFPFIADVVDRAGNVQAGAVVEMRKLDDQTPVAVYAQRNASAPAPDPLLTDPNGRLHVYLDDTIDYEWRAVAGGVAAEWTEVLAPRDGGTSGARIFHADRTWAIQGTVDAAVLPGIFLTEPYTLIGARTKLGSGTSITAQVQRNGANLGSPITVTPASATQVFSQAMAVDDELGLVLSAPVGNPSNLSITLILQLTI
jgi:hypothetical protein